MTRIAAHDNPPPAGPPGTPPALLTLTESAPFLRITPGTAYRWIAENKFPIPLVRVGRQWFIRRVDLEAYLAADVEPPSL